MADFVRNVREIDSADRQAMEHLLGQPLHENEQLVIRVVTAKPRPESTSEPPPPSGATAVLPEWCNVYAGLSDKEIADLERTILTRADLTRRQKRQPELTPH